MGHFSGNHPTDGALVAENRGWELFSLGSDRLKPWQAFKLVSKVKQRKANYWLSSDGNRVAMGRDATLLNTYFPDVFDWVVAALCKADK